jgi:hypothetical protein
MQSITETIGTAAARLRAIWRTTRSNPATTVRLPLPGWAGAAALALLAGAWLAPQAQGGLQLRTTLERYNDGYIFWVDLSTNGLAPAAPLGTYVILSPQQPTNGTHREYELSASGLGFLGGGSWYYNDFAAAMNGITNGNWTISVTNAAATNVYAFQITNNGFTSNLLPTVNITYPTEGMMSVPSQPTFTWEGSAALPGQLTAYAYQRDQNWTWTWSQGISLPTSQTSWAIPAPIPPGQSYFFLQHHTIHASPLFLASTPLHTVTSQPLSGWESASAAILFCEVGFVVSGSGSGGHALVAHYAFDNSGFLGQDFSPNANHITSGSSWGAPVHGFDTDAIAGGGAVRFHGNSSLAPPLAVIDSLAGSFTVSAWIRTSASIGSDGDAAPDGALVVSAFMGWDTDSTVPLALTGDKAAFWTGSPTPPFEYNLHSTSDVTTDEYVHLAVTRDQATGAQRLYVNGELEASATGSTRTLNEPAAVFDLRVGGAVSHGFDGWLDDLQFYSGVLSPAEIATLYSHPGDTIPDGSGGNPLGDAVNAPHLVWTAGGDEPWFAQSVTTHDGASAAQSGAIDDDGMSYLETQVNGPGTLSFWWKVSCEEDADYLELHVDGWPLAYLTGEMGWESYSMELDPGPHTLRWVYTKDFCCTSGDDAGWVDQVQFLPPTTSDVEVSLNLSVVREYDPGYGERYLVFPGFDSFYPDAVTYHSVESPNNLFSGQWNGQYGSSSTWMYSLEAAIEEITAGDWTLYVNKGDPSEQQFTFSVAVSGLTTNILGRTTILSPAYGSVGVATNPPLQWSGPSQLPDLFVSVGPPGGSFWAYTNLISTATNWPSPPSLPSGTNDFYVQYFLTDAPYASFTTPLDAAMQPVASWTATASLRSSTTSRFVVGAPGGRLTNAQLAPGGLQFAFQTVAGRSHAIEARTNLTSGAWIALTNFPGDGSLKQFVFPSTDPAVRFFRARTD